MRFLVLLILATILVAGCSRPVAKFIAPDFEAPRRVVVLPSHNYSVDVDAGRTISGWCQYLMLILC